MFNAVIGNGIIVATGALKGINNVLSALKINTQLDTDLSNLSATSTFLSIILFLAGVAVSSDFKNQIKKSQPLSSEKLVISNEKQRNFLNNDEPMLHENLLKTKKT